VSILFFHLFIWFYFIKPFSAHFIEKSRALISTDLLHYCVVQASKQASKQAIKKNKKRFLKHFFLIWSGKSNFQKNRDFQIYFFLSISLRFWFFAFQLSQNCLILCFCCLILPLPLFTESVKLFETNQIICAFIFVILICVVSVSVVVVDTNLH